MDISEFKIGEHYRYRGQRFQVVDQQGETVQLRAVEARRIVLRQTREVLLRAMKRCDLVKDQEAPIEKDPQKILAGLPKPYAAAFDRRWHYVNALTKRFGGKMPRERSSLMISALAKDIKDISPPSFSTARSWVRAFCKSGHSSLALIPGRRQRAKHRLALQPWEVQQVINQQVSQFYLKAEPACKTEVIDAIVLELGAFNEGRPSHDRLKIPSESTLNRILRELDAYERALAQHGSKYAQKHQGWTRKRDRPGRLFELVEADTQQMHVMVVGSDGEVIGRPYLTVFLEVYTRMPYAWSIGFNPPLWTRPFRHSSDRYPVITHTPVLPSATFSTAAPSSSRRICVELSPCWAVRCAIASLLPAIRSLTWKRSSELGRKKSPT
ncbi:hypothetical protein MZE46_026685 [Pseudomonas sp. A4]|nr:hypothetical protein [Pseudomonas sp. S11A4]